MVALSNTSEGGDRLYWIDIAKGVCIALVVLLHTSFWINDIAPDKHAFWLQISEFISPFRMPLFFAISGILGAKYLPQSFSENSSRIVGLYLIYMFWTALFLARLFIPAARGGLPAPDMGSFLLSLVLPASFWYVWALPVFHLAAWGLHRWVKGFSWVTFAALCLLSVMFVQIDRWSVQIIDEPLDRIKFGPVAANLVWFYLGTHAKMLAVRLVSGATMRNAAFAAVTYVLGIAIVKAAGGSPAMEAKFFLTPIALVLALRILGLVNPEAWASKMFAAIGRQTLPVYIFHIFGISVFSAVIKLSGLVPFVTANLFVFDLIMTPVFAVTFIVCARFAGSIIVRMPLRNLLVPRSFTFGSGRQRTLTPA